MARKGLGELSHLRVQIDEVGNDGIALVVDEFGRHIKVNTKLRVGKGPLPRAGERWFMTRMRGRWVFDACQRTDLPVVTGKTSGLPALDNLIKALADMGLIEDSTNKDAAYFAVHPHIHMTGDGPTSEDTL